MKKMILSAAVAAMAWAGQANASLIVTFQPTSGPASNPVTVTPGQVMHLNVVATVTGSNGTADEGLQSLFGSAVSNPGSSGPVGDFSNFVPSSTFNTVGTNQNGKQQDVNGLPGLDVGTSDSLSNYSPSDYIFVRDPSGQAPANGTGDTSTYVIGTIDFTVNSAGNGGTTSLYWVPRTSGGAPVAQSALWKEDGASKFGTTGTYGGDPTSFTITAAPEPGTLGLAAIGGLGLLLRRRRK